METALMLECSCARFAGISICYSVAYSFGKVLQKTGLVDQAAASLVMLLQHTTYYVSLLVIYVITLLATELLSNVASWP